MEWSIRGNGGKETGSGRVNDGTGLGAVLGPGLTIRKKIKLETYFPTSDSLYRHVRAAVRLNYLLAAQVGKVSPSGSLGQMKPQKPARGAATVMKRSNS